MRQIVIHEPVWNGGSPYLSVRVDKLQNIHNFIRCDYEDRSGVLMYPYAFYINDEDAKKLDVHTEKWGKAYRLYINDLEKVSFYCTIGWDGGEMNEGEVSYQRASYTDLLEAVQESLEKYKARNPYFVCASMETTKGNHSVDFTSIIRTELNL